jgi:hypothetical protein
MKRKILAALFASAVLCTAAPVQAQAPALVGKWSIEYERGRRMENGETTIIPGKATLMIAQSGDSLLATFDTGPRRDGSTAPPSTVGGRMTPDGAVFVQQQTATINMNGDAQERQITLRWTLQAEGDVLTGSLARTLPGMENGPPSAPVKGSRIADK